MRRIKKEIDYLVSVAWNSKAKLRSIVWRAECVSLLGGVMIGIDFRLVFTFFCMFTSLTNCYLLLGLSFFSRFIMQKWLFSEMLLFFTDNLKFFVLLYNWFLLYKKEWKNTVIVLGYSLNKLIVRLSYIITKIKSLIIYFQSHSIILNKKCMKLYCIQPPPHLSTKQTFMEIAFVCKIP